MTSSRSRAPRAPQPASLVVLSSFWGVIALLLALPYAAHEWTDHHVMDGGGSSTEITSPPHPNLWLALCIATAVCAGLAGVLSLRWPRVAWILCLAPLIPLAIESHGVNIALACAPSFLGVASALIHRNRLAAWAAAGAALVVPALFAFVSQVALWVSAGAIVSSSGADLNKRIEMFALYALLILLAMACATGVSVQARRREEWHAIALRGAEVDARAAIARDLHDVVAHRMSLVAVRAETAPYQHPGMTDSLRQEFADIATDARGALDEMRQVLGVLDRGGDAAPQLEPQPQSADIERLVAQAREAGSPVVLDGAVPALGEVLGNTVYRVVQECLTNVRRHAPNETATVSFMQSGDESDAGLMVRVSNPVSPQSSETFEMGRGLAGMRQRVELSGGMFHVKHANGEFVVEAMWPASVVTHG